MMKVALVIDIFILISLGSAFDLSPANPNPGDKVSLTGKVSPGKQVCLRSSFSMDLPVSGGNYEETQ